jgi:hypothetical protein
MKKAITIMKNSNNSSKEAKGGNSISLLIDARIKELADWRGEVLARGHGLTRNFAIADALRSG